MSMSIPGKVIVREFSLINNPNTADSTKTNIWAMIDGMSIYENIFQMNMWGVAKVLDSYNLYNTLPITNETWVLISLQDPTTGYTVQKHFKVFKVSNVIQETTKLQSYIIHFVSSEMYYSQYMRITKHVIGNIPKEVEAIHKKISTQPIEINEDSSKTNLYLPFMTANQAINLLVTNAKWNSTMPDYCYWETMDGFNCKSLSACMLQNPVHDFSTNVTFQNDPYADSPYGDFIKIDEFISKQAFDGINTLYSGYEGVSIYSYDPIKGLCSENKVGNIPLSRIYTFPDSTLDYVALSQRNQLLNSISNSYYYINVPGLLMRSAGDGANVTIYNGNNYNTKDITLSGRKLICGIVHVISIDSYNQHITLGDYTFGG